MKINNELLLMYHLGRINDSVVRDYITEQLETDAELAARFRQLTDTEETEEEPVSRETMEALDYFFDKENKR